MMKSTFVLLSCWTFSANKENTSWVVSSLGIWEIRCSTSAEETAGQVITISDSLFVTLQIWFLLNAREFQKTILVCTFVQEMIKRWQANVSDLFWALPSVHCWKFFSSMRAARKSKFQTDPQIKYHILSVFVVHLLSGIVWGREHEHSSP